MSTEKGDPLRQELAEEKVPAKHSRCPTIDVKLFPYKSFYFLFFSAAGSLFPYLAIFYKQLWLSAQQTGVLIGIRPILQLVSSLTWGIVADKSDKSKYIFLISLIGWLFSNFSLSLVHHKRDIGSCHYNGSLPVLDIAAFRTVPQPILRNRTFKMSEAKRTLKLNYRNDTSTKKLKHSKESNAMRKQLISKLKSSFQNGMAERKIEKESSIGHAPWFLDAMINFEAMNKNETGHNRRTFAILLIITIVGTLIAAPAIPFADTATLQALGDEKDFYGKQRQWGAIGWGISSFLIGSMVGFMQERSNCNVPYHINYQPCFYAFAVLMVFTFIPAWFIKFEETRISTASLIGKLQTLMKFNTIVFLLTVQQFGNSWGLVQTFLLWHLQDLGGTQFLFSIVAAVQCLSEVISYHIAGYAITKFGHYQVLCVGLLFSALRFTTYAAIKNPWYVLPIEIFHGLSTTLIWALAVSFISLNAGVATTMQGLLSGIHWGVGLGGGAILGGMLVNAIGSKYTFIAYGILTFFILLGFILTQNMKCFMKRSEERQSLLGLSTREELEFNSVNTTAEASETSH